VEHEPGKSDTLVIPCRYRLDLDLDRPVLLMTPALAFFYGGLVRSKNALNTMMMSFISLGFVGVAWAILGYSLSFSAGNNWIGDMSRVFLRGVGSSRKARFRTICSCAIRAPSPSSRRH
jgi:ammonia channel protein AmtB